MGNVTSKAQRRKVRLPVDRGCPIAMDDSPTNHDNTSYSNGLVNDLVEQSTRSSSQAYTSMSSFDHQHPATFSQPHPSETSISSSVDDQVHGLESLPLPENPQASMTSQLQARRSREGFLIS
jgi:hypothetical protein